MRVRIDRRTLTRAARTCALLACALPGVAAFTDLAIAEPLSYFGDAQVLRGAALYDVQCGACHGGRLEGGSAVTLKGEAFLSRWRAADLNMDDLLYLVRTQMPHGAPDSLSRTQYLDIVCFMLQRNGYPGGAEELPGDRSILSVRKLRR